MLFKDIQNYEKIYLYCGDMSIDRRQNTLKPFIGLSLTKNDSYHINHDITNKFDIRDNCVDIIQSEDVMEHIEYSKLEDCINEIYRVLKVGGLFRLSLPDYRCDLLYNRSLKDERGEIYFDFGGGGQYDYVNKKVIDGGHVWFPNYESVKKLLEKTKFKDGKIDFLHYYDENSSAIMRPIDHSLGFVERTPENDERVKNPRRPMSIVVDCYKI